MRRLMEHLESEAPLLARTYSGEVGYVWIALDPGRTTIDGEMSLDELRALVKRLEKEETACTSTTPPSTT